MSTPGTAAEAQRIRDIESTVEIPETLGYRIKNVLLGPPMVTEQLATERLGSLMAMGVLAPDGISSSAYGTEEMLVELVKYVGRRRRSRLVLPVTFALVAGAVLRHPLLPGSRDGLHQRRRLVRGCQGQLRPDRRASRRRRFAHRLYGHRRRPDCRRHRRCVGVPGVPVTAFWACLRPCGSVLLSCVLMAYGNLRGIREAGRIFAFPTYFFIFRHGSVIITGVVRSLIGNLPQFSVHRPGLYPFGHPGSGLLMGASLFS